MKTIKYKGEDVQAYDLLMKKVHAIDIISGKKRVEIRSFSDHYCRLFDSKKRDNEGKKITRKDIQFIHFHDYNNSWFLNVKIKKVDLGEVTKEWSDGFIEHYNFHDFENEWQKYTGCKKDDIPMYFWLPIVEVIDHNISN